MKTKELQVAPPSRLPKSAHSSRPWRIHEIAHDFMLEDVWRLPTPGGPDDFPRLIAMLVSSGPPDKGASPLGHLLWSLRWKLGKWFGWDREDNSLDPRVVSLREFLPADLRDTKIPKDKSSRFISLYLTDDEYAAEIANRTVHAIMHLSWIKDESGLYCGQMAVLVKPNGFFGRLYMVIIKPFRHLIIYPALLRRFGRDWSQMYGIEERTKL